MKRLLFSIFLLLALSCSAQFAFTNIYTGVTNNDRQGDTLKLIAQKVNTNFYYLTNVIIFPTNWLLNVYYTNPGPQVWTVSATSVFTNAAVAGQNELNLYMGAQGASSLTNVSPSGGQTLGTGLATTNFGFVSYPMAAGVVFAFSNITAGAGNTCGLKNGTGVYVQR